MGLADTVLAFSSLTQEVASLNPFTILTNIFTDRIQSMGKVMFLHVSVILFMGGLPSEGDCPLGWGGVCMEGGSAWRGVCMEWGGLQGGSVCMEGGGVCMDRTFMEIFQLDSQNAQFQKI